MGHHSLLSGHERVEAVTRHVGGIVLVEAPTCVSSMSARSKNSVSTGPGISEVTLTPVSFSSFRSASAKDCTKDFDALYTA